MRAQLAARYRWWRTSGRSYGNRPDLAIAFLERSIELAGPRGIVAVLVPAKIASAGYGAAARHAVASTTTLHVIANLTERDGAEFDATVYPMALDDPEAAIEELGGIRNITIDVTKPELDGEVHRFEHGTLELPSYEVGDEVATRKAYGDTLKALGDGRGDVVALDGEVSNSTFAEMFRNAHPDRYFEMYIAEQQMVAAAVGIQVRGWKPYASTFAAFLSRAYDFVRMAAISRANLKLVGSHAGVSIGEDGPSQMALEDLAAFRAVHGSTVLYPSDANQTAKLVEAMADLDGIVFLRTTRANTPVIYEAGEDFPVGGAKVVRSSESDDVALIGAGITLHEALKAADALAEAAGERVDPGLQLVEPGRPGVIAV
jgi:transketolase